MKKLLILMVLTLAGCTDDESKYKHSESIMPKEAHNKKDLGNGWIAFDLKIDGKTNKFMINYYGGRITCLQINENSQ